MAGWRINRQTAFSLLVPFLLPFFAFAASGACSDHGGVDCSAGAGSYGQVICNDGWTDSSVSYDSMSECQQTPSVPMLSNTCVPPAISGCTETSEYMMWETQCTQEQEQEQQQAQSYCGRMQSAIGAEGGLGGYTCPPPSTSASAYACAEATLCQTQLSQYTAAEQAYMTCNANYQQYLTNRTQLEEQQLEQAQAQLQQAQIAPTSTILDSVPTGDNAPSSTPVAAPSASLTSSAHDPLIAGIKPAGTQTHAFHTGFADPLAGANVGTTSTSIASTSVTVPQHVSEGLLSRIYNTIGSFFNIFRLYGNSGR